MKDTYKALIIAAAFFLNQQAKAQLNPISAQNYTNPYLANPALAGITGGIKINAGYRSTKASESGSITTQHLTLDQRFKNNGLGIRFTKAAAENEQQGRFSASYAYHLPLNNDGGYFSFGGSLGILNQQLSTSKTFGLDNNSYTRYTYTRRSHLDGDLGVAYTTGQLAIQAAIPNLISFRQINTLKAANISRFHSAASYKINASSAANSIQFEPRIAYNQIEDHGHIWDAGMQTLLAERKLLLLTTYHSTESATFGFGLNYRKKFLISTMYTTKTLSTRTLATKTYINYAYEINLRLSY